MRKRIKQTPARFCIETGKPRATPPPPASPPLVLASASPRRIALLRAAGLEPAVIPAHTREWAPRHFTPREVALWNAMRKAEAVAARFPAAVVIGADTLVVIDGQILGKPRSVAVARRMLRRLSGRRHEVYSGVWLCCRGRRWRRGFTAVSGVRFRPLADEEIATYIVLAGSLDKAGGYAAQEDPLGIIAAIEGSRTNVIGLPLTPVLARLRQVGIEPRPGRRPASGAGGAGGGMAGRGSRGATAKPPPEIGAESAV